MKKRVCLSLAMCFWALITIAQTTIKGKVLDDDNKPLEGASVAVKNAKVGTKTNEKGEFILKVEKVPVNLVVSYVNHASKTIVHNGSGILDVVLTVDSAGSADDDVVVMGYQTVKRKEVLAPVSSVSAGQLKDVPLVDPAQALNGRLAGVTATASEGSPDAEIDIKVRGGSSITQSNAPLYIIDGVQVESGLAGLVLQDIQSIDVLKDAAATAIYGARGANGVVIITTKSGKVGKLKVQYSGFVGVRSINNKLDVLSPYDYVIGQYERELSTNSATKIESFHKRFGTYFDTFAVYKDISPVNWQDEVLGRNAITNSHSLSLSGGNKTINFIAGITHNNDQGVALMSNIQRNVFNLKLNYNPIKDLKIGFSGRIINQVVDGAGVSDEGSTAYNRMRHVIKYKPYLLPGESVTDFDEDDYDASNEPGNNVGIMNPLLLMQSEIRKKNRLTTNGGINVQYNITKSLSFKSTVGVDYQRERNYFWKDTMNSDARINGGMKPVIDLDSISKLAFSNSNVLTWKKKFRKKHNWVALAGHEIYNVNIKRENYKFMDLPYSTTGFGASEAAKNPNVGRSFTAYPNLYEAKSKQLSFFSKVDYSFEDKYLLSGIVRADGSSKFAKENRWGTFKSLSFAWRASNEKFLENSKVISDLKLRASYGEAGNNRIDDYLFLSTFTDVQDGETLGGSRRMLASIYGLGNTPFSGLRPNAAVNYDLKWETNISKNIGIDVAFGKRLDLTVDVYENIGKDLLMDAPIASVTGYSSKMMNVGKTRNRGVEVQLNVTAIQKKNFSWTLTLNNSWNRNKVLNLADGDSLYINSGWSLARVPDYLLLKGQPIGLMFGYITDGFYKPADFTQADPTIAAYTLKSGVPVPGIIPNPGDIKFKDISGPNGLPDGKIDSYDKTVIGNAVPKFTGGLLQQFRYKNFDLNVFVNWRVGGDVMNATKIEGTNAYNPLGNNLAEANNNRFTIIDKETGRRITSLTELEAVNADASMWMPALNVNNAFSLHSWAIEDGSFLRINNISLGYTFKSVSIKRIGLSSLRIYGTVNNVAIFTNYSGYDPEVNTRRSTNITPNVDFSAYPRSRGFVFGINASL